MHQSLASGGARGVEGSDDELGSGAADGDGGTSAEGERSQAKAKEDASKTGGPTPAASTLVARTGRASGWRLDDRLVRTAVCPAGQRNPSSHEECLASLTL